MKKDLMCELVTKNEIRKNAIVTNTKINFRMIVKFLLFLAVFSFSVFSCIQGYHRFTLLACQIGLGLAFLNLQKEF